MSVGLFDFEGGVGEVEGFGYGFEGDLAVDYVDAVGESAVAAAGLFPAEVGETNRVRERGVGQRHRRGVGHRAGYVGDGILHDSVDNEGRFAMRGRVGGLEAAALVDGDVDHH